ncbi:MAG: threonine--tRNA ligase [Pseudomonadota bacterium]
MSEIALTFPDDSVRNFPAGITGSEIVAGISKSLAKKTVALVRDGELADLSDALDADCAVEFIDRTDPRALELIRHDAAHVMAEAVQELFPGTQVTIGPVIENGFYYDFAREEGPFTPEDLPKIEKKMREIIKRNAKFAKEVWSRDEAKRVFEEKGETYKIELIDAIPGDEDLKIYRQGNWFDLCRGPHMVSTGQIGNSFKLMSVAGAYWRGDSDREMLTRIYATAWASDDDLKAYLHMLEEAEKRDHRKLGREMDLFHFQDDAPGTAFWHPDGWSIYQSLISYMRRMQTAIGYEEVNAPELLDQSLWETSGHWEKYHENMFTSETEDGRHFALKPMNCPGHVQIFKHGLKSYRELPVKYAEFGKVHRYEPSGALHGLMRVRGFTQDDAHVFCTEDQIKEESIAIHELIMQVYQDFGFDHVLVKLSTRPEVRVGADELWDRAESVMKEVLDDIEASSDGKVTTGIAEGEGAFYGPKFEYTLRDAIGREWQMGTNQVDFNLPARFGAFYIDSSSNKVTPVMLHRAILGSLERFIGVIIENYAGKMPLWIAPRQIVVASITTDANAYAQRVCDELKAAGLRAEVDGRNEKINYKVREISLAKVPVILVVGNREAEEGSVNMRRLGSRDQTPMALADAKASLVAEAVAPDLRRAASLAEAAS